MRGINGTGGTEEAWGIGRPNSLGESNPESRLIATPGTLSKVTNGSIPPAEKSSARRLTLRQQLFLRFYVLHGNGSRAAREAGYMPPFNVAAAKILRGTKLQTAVRESLKGAGLDRDLLIHSLIRILQYDIGDLLSFDPSSGKPSIDLQKGMATGATCIVRRIAWRNGKPAAITLHDPVRVIERLAKLSGWTR